MEEYLPASVHVGLLLERWLWSLTRSQQGECVYMAQLLCYSLGGSQTTYVADNVSDMRLVSAFIPALPD